jgi:hypothetical protein
LIRVGIKIKISNTMFNLKNVSVYNLKNELVLSGCSGTLNQEKTDTSFNSSLGLTVTAAGKLTAGESYYAIGTTDDNNPVRSERVTCITAGDKATFEGSIPLQKKSTTASAAAASEADIQIKYTNYTATQFNRGSWGSNLQLGFGSLTNTPGPTLAAKSGVELIGASQMLSTLDEGPADIWLEWYAGSVRFGVWVHFNFQFAGAGYRPEWHVSTNGSAWAPNGDDPSVPYTWDAGAVGFKIVGRPTSGHSSLMIDVTITTK